MKDHSVNSAEQKKYILSYKVEAEKIVAKLASGEFYTIPYSEENEQAIILRMEKQARSAEITPISFSDKFFCFALSLALPILVLLLIVYGGWVCFTLFSLTVICELYYSKELISNIIKKMDIAKLNYFLDNQQKLNDNIGKNENVLLNVRKKAINQIKSEQSKGKRIFNINNIDNYSLKDLKTLKENIERIASFGFKEEDMSKDFSEDSGPVLKKTLDSMKK